MTTAFASKEDLAKLLKSWVPLYEAYAGMFDLGIRTLTQLQNVSVGTLATLLAKVANQVEDIEHTAHAEDIIKRASAGGFLGGWPGCRGSGAEAAKGCGRAEAHQGGHQDIGQLLHEGQRAGSTTTPTT